jgi:prolyl-tRNA editing enzyme YbaK/EbsC (Cys-tRNA(Pro) deacylase)
MPYSRVVIRREPMSIEKVRAYLAPMGFADRIQELDQSSATVELAARALGTEEARIAKTMSFYGTEEETAILVVVAGDQKVNSGKFKRAFGMKARMLSGADVERLTGHAPGGVCPFANPSECSVYLDVSLQRFETVFPAAGSANSAVEMTCAELERASNAKGWVDLCKGPEAAE